MNKKLVAVAIAGLLAAPLAQAQTANVTLYGRLNVDMEVVNGKQPITPNNGSNPNVFRLSTNSSRFGIRGTESLGGGLSAIFQIEQNVPGDGGNQTATTGNTAIPTTSTPAGIATRETFVGLQGSWGTFKMGRFLAPYDDIHPIFGNVPTLTTSILNTAVLWGQGQVGQPENGGFDDRVRNSVRYDSPTLAGFNASVQYGSAEMAQLVPGASNLSTQQKSSAGVWSMGAYYNNGPIQIGTAYEQHNQIRGVGLNDKAFSIAGGYQFTNFRIGGVWQRLSYDIAPLIGVTNGVTQLKGDMWGAGVTWNLGPGQLYGFYGKQLEGKGSAPVCPTLACVADVNRPAGKYAAPRVGGLTAGPSSAAQQWEVSYTYPLSKRTLLQAGYVKIINESNAAYTFNISPYGICTNNGTACGSSGSPGGFMAGMVHLF